MQNEICSPQPKAIMKSTQQFSKPRAYQKSNDKLVCHSNLHYTVYMFVDTVPVRIPFREVVLICVIFQNIFQFFFFSYSNSIFDIQTTFRCPFKLKLNDNTIYQKQNCNTLKSERPKVFFEFLTSTIGQVFRKKKTFNKKNL